MKIQGRMPVNHNPMEKAQTGIVQGRLARLEDGTLVLKSRGDDFPVRLLNMHLPLGELLTLRIVGQEGSSLILSAGQNGLPDGLGDLLQSWGFDIQGPWRQLAEALFEENLPITRDNLISLERWMRIAEHRWGVKANPRLLAYVLAKQLPFRSETLLLAFHRLFPELRKEFPPELLARRALNTDPEDVKRITPLLQEFAEFEATKVAGDKWSWAGFFGTETGVTPDGGEIHWRRETTDDAETPRDTGVLLELFPPDLGWVRTYITWKDQEFWILFEVDREYLSHFREALLDWENKLKVQGYNVVVSLQEQKRISMDLLKPVDRWV